MYTYKCVYVYDYKQEDDIACANAVVQLQIWYCSIHLFSVIGNDDRKDYDITEVSLDEISIRNLQILQLCLCLGTEYLHATSPKFEQWCLFGSCSPTSLRVLFDHLRQNTEVVSKEGARLLFPLSRTTFLLLG